MKATVFVNLDVIVSGRTEDELLSNALKEFKELLATRGVDILEIDEELEEGPFETYGNDNE